MDSNFVTLITYLCIAAYVVVGRWIALTSWNLWHLPAGNRVLAKLFFPTLPFYNPDHPLSLVQCPDTYWHINHGMFEKDDSVSGRTMPLIICFMSKNKYLYEKKVLYVLFTTLLWPAKIGLNLIYIAFEIIRCSVDWLIFRIWKMCKFFFFAFFPTDKQIEE